MRYIAVLNFVSLILIGCGDGHDSSRRLQANQEDAEERCRKVMPGVASPGYEGRRCAAAADAYRRILADFRREGIPPRPRMYYAELLHPSGGQLLVLYVDFQWDAVSLRIVTSKRQITCPLVASSASAEKLAERFDDDPLAIHHAIVHQADAGGEKPLVLEPQEHAGRIEVSLILRDGTVMSPIEVVQYHE